MSGRLAIAVFTVLLGIGISAEAGPPTDQLKGVTDQVFRLLQDPEFRKPAKLEESRKQIRAVADDLFHWQEITRRALGRHWQQRTSQEREEFSTLFADFIEQVYFRRLESYSGERILYMGEAVDGTQATVRTKFVTKSATEIPIDYRMLKEGDRWRAYDVLIEGVSLVSNYRTQFNRIIQQSGYDELVKKLTSKHHRLVFEQAEAKKRP